MSAFAQPILAAMLIVVPGASLAGPVKVDDQALQRILAERVETQRWATGVVVGITAPQDRRIVSYGKVGLHDRRPVDGDTVFEIASLTKVFTALLLADMAQRNEVALQAPVADCLSAAEVTIPTRNGRKISFADLATHTSGLPLRPTNLASQIAVNKYAGYTVEQLYQGLSSYTLGRDIGAGFEYSNWGFGLLGHALARCAGRNYAAALRNHVTRPLGMNDTRLNLLPGMKRRLAAGHDDRLVPVPNTEVGALEGAGGLYSTANDLLTFLEVFLGRKESLLIAATELMLEVRRPGDDPATQIALGWRVSSSMGRQIVWSNGRSDGYRAFMGYDVQSRVGVIALANASTNVGVDDIARHVLDPRLQPVRPHKRMAISATLMNRYVGRYRFDDGSIMTITRESDRLISQLTDQGPVELFAQSECEFFPDEIEAKIVFDRPTEGPASAVTLHQDSQSWRAERISATGETPP